VDSGHPPLRALFGAQAQQIVTDIHERRLQTWQDGAELARQSHGKTDCPVFSRPRRRCACTIWQIRAARRDHGVAS
jgi:hypothetical protein